MSASIPAACPGGPGSEMAGKASACEGCPSRQLCESAPKGPDPDIAIIGRRLKNIKRKIVILSGKGGVGKSTVTALLTRSLAHSDEELAVGLLDIDMTGPSADLFMGLKGEEVHKSASGWTPCYVDDIAVMSTGFILEEDKALIWGGARKTGLMKDFLKEVEWDELDYLLIDTPPGTSDEHMGIVTLMADAGIDGGIIVTTPSEVALADVQRQLQFCAKVNLKVLGVIENMSGFTCPKCSVTSPIFKPSATNVTEFCLKNNLALLGQLPIDPVICRCLDQGQNPMELTSPVITEIGNITQRLRELFE